jgi:cytochrome c-type biogenesis protein
LIVGFISGQGKITRARAFGVSSLFALGILSTIALIGLITARLGKMLGDTGAAGNYVVAAVFFLVGLVLLDIVPVPFSGPGGAGIKRRGMLAAFILGLVFGLALGPCTFAYMAPVLAISFKAAATHLIYAIALLAVYGLGHCSVIVLAGTSTEVVQQYLNWNEKSKGTVILKRACGALVVLGGAYLIWAA